MLELIIGLALIPFTLVGLYILWQLFIHVVVPLAMIGVVLAAMIWGGTWAYDASQHSAVHAQHSNQK